MVISMVAMGRKMNGAEIGKLAHDPAPKPQAERSDGPSPAPLPTPALGASLPRDRLASSSDLPQLSERRAKRKASSAAHPASCPTQVARSEAKGRGQWGILPTFLLRGKKVGRPPGRTPASGASQDKSASSGMNALPRRTIPPPLRPPLKRQINHRRSEQSQQLTHQQAPTNVTPTDAATHCPPRPQHQRQGPSKAAKVVIRIGRNRSRQAW